MTASLDRRSLTDRRHLPRQLPFNPERDRFTRPVVARLYGVPPAGPPGINGYNAGREPRPPLLRSVHVDRRCLVQRRHLPPPCAVRTPPAGPRTRRHHCRPGNNGDNADREPRTLVSRRPPPSPHASCHSTPVGRPAYTAKSSIGACIDV
jgi:hypothetical protein